MIYWLCPRATIANTTHGCTQHFMNGNYQHVWDPYRCNFLPMLKLYFSKKYTLYLERSQLKMLLLTGTTWLHLSSQVEPISKRQCSPQRPCLLLGYSLYWQPIVSTLRQFTFLLSIFWIISCSVDFTPSRNKEW